MWRPVPWGMALFSLMPAMASDRTYTASAERLWGFEAPLRAAVAEQKVPLRLLPAGQAADLRLSVEPRFASSAAFLAYRKATGREEDAVLELYDPRSRRVLASSLVRLNSGEAARRHAARAFLDQVKRRLPAP